MTRSSYTLIVGAAPVPGEGRAYRHIVEAAQHVIAADGGLAVCLAAGRMPEVVLGDFDSLAPRMLEQARDAGVKIVRHPVEKNESDLDLALSYARETGSAGVCFTAAFSGRIDHTLAALGTLLRSADLDGRLAEPKLDGYALHARHRPSIVLAASPGQTMSVFAFDPETVVSMEGVRYPLVSQPLPVLSSLGLSNVALGREQTFTVHAGSALVLVQG